PTDVKGKHLILANRSHCLGSLEFYLENRVLKASFLRGNWDIIKMDTKLEVPVDKWSSIKVSYDQITFVFEVNSVKSAKFACKGPGGYDTPTTVGGYDTWFKGYMRNLRISHALRN
ncbi:MAG: hypothetical protein KAG97_10690, partial [Victivallales bacterium]|nr:hypothetical protein [Victivallales bacterium]